MPDDALRILDVIDGIVDDTHPEGDGCPLCAALDDLRAALAGSGPEARLREALEAELAKQRGLPSLMRSSGYESGIEFALRALAATPTASPTATGERDR